MIKKFSKNFRHIRNVWIPRQIKAAGGKGPNATEAKFYREILLPNYSKLNSKIVYQPNALILTKTTKREYTADYMMTLQDGSKIYIEVKGSYHLPTHERARLAWEIAAEQNSKDIFMWAELTRRGWEIETWACGGKEIYVQEPGDNAPHMASADWRRHRRRK